MVRNWKRERRNVCRVGGKLGTELWLVASVGHRGVVLFGLVLARIMLWHLLLLLD
jgi:hypothetical protein